VLDLSCGEECAPPSRIHIPKREEQHDESGAAGLNYFFEITMRVRTFVLLHLKVAELITREIVLESRGLK